MHALVRPALAVLVLTGLGVASARRPGRDELAQPNDCAQLCALDGDRACGKTPSKAPPALAVVGHVSARVAFAVVEAPALPLPALALRAHRVLADAPKTSPPV